MNSWLNVSLCLSVFLNVMLLLRFKKENDCVNCNAEESREELERKMINNIRELDKVRSRLREIDNERADILTCIVTRNNITDVEYRTLEKRSLSLEIEERELEKKAEELRKEGNRIKIELGESKFFI